MSTKRIIFIVAAVIILAAGIYLAYIMLSPPLSPKGLAEYDNGDLKITIEYSRPSKRGRLIFGEKSDGALQPYGEYWRVGANAATKFIVNKDITFGGKTLEQGEYSLYAFPGKDEWEIGVNSEANRGGAQEPDYEKDVLKIKVPVTNEMPELEQFTISFGEEGDTVNMVWRWDRTLVSVPIQEL